MPIRLFKIIWSNINYALMKIKNICCLFSFFLDGCEKSFFSFFKVQDKIRQEAPMRVMEVSGHLVSLMITLRNQHSLVKAVVPLVTIPNRVLLEVG